MGRVLEILQAKTSVEHQGSFSRDSRTYFDQTLWRLTPFDYVSCNLTDFELQPNDVRSDLVDLSVDLDNPIAVFHPTESCPVTEIYYRTRYPDQISGAVYVHVVFDSRFQSDYIYHLKNDPMCNVPQSGITVNLEAVGSELDVIFNTVMRGTSSYP